MYVNRDVRYDHVAMFILYLPLAVFSFSVKSSSFALASKARISLHSVTTGADSICLDKAPVNLQAEQNIKSYEALYVYGDDNVMNQAYL